MERCFQWPHSLHFASRFSSAGPQKAWSSLEWWNRAMLCKSVNLCSNPLSAGQDISLYQNSVFLPSKMGIKYLVPCLTYRKCSINSGYCIFFHFLVSDTGSHSQPRWLSRIILDLSLFFTVAETAKSFNINSPLFRNRLLLLAEYMAAWNRDYISQAHL